MDIFEEISMSKKFFFKSILFKNKAIYCILVLLILAFPASAEVYISDHFDDQANWQGKNGTCNDPPLPWEAHGYFCDTIIYIDNTDDAHVGGGSTGKCLRINWTPSMNELGLHTPEALVQNKQELWIGYWFKHGTWNWGGDTTYKWFYGPQSGGGRMMINYDKEHRAYWNGKTHLQSNIAFTTTDTDWHSVIIYLKHNTNASYDGEIRLWWDGVEATWDAVGDYTSNTTLRFDSISQTGWDWSLMAFGFQSRPDWGPGNISYFDDIIVASTKEEVESFLFNGSFPSAPKNLRIKADS